MNILAKFQKTVVFILKATLYVSLAGSFFLIFGTKYEWILHPSRTAGVTFVTFCVLETALLSVYGGYLIGRLKSKPIVISISLATILTDLVTHFQLCIMNVNENNNSHFVYESPHLLILVMLIQIALIILFTYFGNYVFFTINAPEKCCIITSSEQSLNNIVPKIKRYKKQYKITDMVHYTSKNVFDIIGKCDTIFLYDVPVQEKVYLSEYCFANDKNIYYNFEMNDIVMLASKSVVLDDKPLVSAVVHDLTLEQRFMKRTMDIVLSLIALIIAGPFMLIVSAAIKLEDGGHIFFRQTRATKGGKLFKVYKFRTMKEDNCVNRSVTSGDDRITKVGKYLRKFRLDELPQIFNILKGEMSIVGPRPEMIENVDKYTEELPEFSYRLRVKGGLTGYAQIAGKYNTSPKDKLVLDLIYIEKYSIWLDIKLILQTVTVLLKAGDSTEAFSKKSNKYHFTEEYDN
ncbi:MAG: sugar transferase [Oscillospiraceae bacterium]|nr:sugar transferase [Oscillospiraceae bacterium]